MKVLIPLLVDDPLWVAQGLILTGCIVVLIPLLVDDPLWVDSIVRLRWPRNNVLIPLLVDDPLWEFVL